MPPFPKPKFPYDWNKDTELQAIRTLQAETRFGIPTVNHNQILVGTWNVANLDTQKRNEDCFPLIAEIIRPFNLIAIQEVNADLIGIMKIMKLLGNGYACVFTDVAGNEERLCYIYKPIKVKLAEMIGELSIPPSRKYWMQFLMKNGKKMKMYFQGFDRTPYVSSWEFNSQKFTTYNCHLYFGDTEMKNIDKFRRRILEVDALARWVDNRVKNHIEKEYSSNIILLGDMNIPYMKKDDPVYKQLTKRNMEGIPYHNHLEEGSNLEGNQYYDQLVFVKPFSDKIMLKRFGIFAWDNAVFSSLWEETKRVPPTKTAVQFRAYAKWAISDHRVLWSLLEITN